MDVTKEGDSVFQWIGSFYKCFILSFLAPANWAYWIFNVYNDNNFNGACCLSMTGEPIQAPSSPREGEDGSNLEQHPKVPYLWFDLTKCYKHAWFSPLFNRLVIGSDLPCFFSILLAAWNLNRYTLLNGALLRHYWIYSTFNFMQVYSCDMTNKA